MAARVQLGLPAVWPLEKLRLPRPTWTWALVIAAIAVEVAGRGSSSDLQEGWSLLVLGAVLTAGWLSQGRDAFPWARRALRVLRGTIASVAGNVETGLDLRGDPPVPRACPPTLRRVLLASTVSLVTVVLVVHACDLWIRPLVVTVAYLPWLLALATLWFLLLAAIVTAVVLALCCMHDLLLSHHGAPTPDMVRRLLVLMLVFLSGLLAAGARLPVWVPLLASICGSIALAITFSVVAGTDMAVLWRQRNGGPVRAFSWRRFETGRATGVVLTFLTLVVVSLGDTALGGADVPAPDGAATPITHVLGVMTAWTTGATLCGILGLACVWLVRQSRRDPALPQPTALAIDAVGVAADVVREALANTGWSLHFDRRRAPPEAVALDVVAAPPPGPPPRHWPPRVTPRALALPELRAAVVRRDHVQRRRGIVRGFQRLFRHAAARSFHRGQGCLLAPQYWFVVGMSRDVDEDGHGDGPLPGGMIGPPYHVVFPPAARQHLHHLLQAAKIDLVFVEDGVGFRRFRRVLRVLFEHTDIHGDRLPVGDHHFAGLPGTRVMVHDYELGSPLREEGYPSPDFDTLGRARVLHVFRDRGGRTEPNVVPADVTGLPVLV